MAKNTYSTQRYDVPHFPGHAFAVTPSDSVDLVDDSGFVKGVSLLVTVTGDVVVTPLSGEANVTLTAVPAYFTIPFRVRAVLSTGTTATVVGIS